MKLNRIILVLSTALVLSCMKIDKTFVMDGPKIVGPEEQILTYVPSSKQANPLPRWATYNNCITEQSGDGGIIEASQFDYTIKGEWFKITPKNRTIEIELSRNLTPNDRFLSIVLQGNDIGPSINLTQKGIR